jgi:hypothetical protein
VQSLDRNRRHDQRYGQNSHFASVSKPRKTDKNKGCCVNSQPGYPVVILRQRYHGTSFRDWYRWPFRIAEVLCEEFTIVEAPKNSRCRIPLHMRTLG